MDSTDIQARLEIELAGLSSLLNDDQYDAAIENALLELGWSLPVTSKKALWTIKRSKRYCYEILRSNVAEQYKYNQINRDQKFKHYTILIEEMDAEFKSAVEEEPSLFAEVDATKMFGTYIGAGFVYNDLGQDLTHVEDE